MPESLRRPELSPPFLADLWTRDDFCWCGALNLDFGDQGAPEAALVLFGECGI